MLRPLHRPSRGMEFAGSAQSPPPVGKTFMDGMPKQDTYKLNNAYQSMPTYLPIMDIRI